MPIFNGLESFREAEARQLSIVQAKDELAKNLLLIEGESRALIAEYEASEANLSSLELAVESAAEARRAFQVEYQSRNLKPVRATACRARTHAKSNSHWSKLNSLTT